MSTPAVLAALSLTHSAQAQLYWDINGTTASANSTTTAAGTWDTATSNWNTVADGTGTTQLWSGGSTPVTAVFSAGTNVTGAYGVTISGTITGVNGITFEEGTVNLNTGTLSLSAPTITANAATSTISGILSGNVGLTKVGTGLVVLTNTGNNYTGATTINAGAVRFNVVGSLAGDPGASLTLGGATAVAGFGYTTFSQTDLNRVSSGSVGTVALAFGTTVGQIDANNLDFSAAGANLANVYLGALSGNNATISGVITPFSNIYRFGSGGGTLQVATTLTAGNSISIGNGTTTGSVSFAGVVTNQTTADLTINTGGTLIVAADAELGDNVTNPSQAVQFNGGNLTIGGTSPVIGHNMTFSSGAGTITTATNPTLSGIFSGTQAFTKAGAGKLILSGNISGYTGAATVSAGTLEVNTALPATSVTVAGTLGGVGSISNGGSSLVTVNAAGHLTPGLDSGTLAGNPTFTADNLTLAAVNSNMDERLGASSTNDLVSVTGTFTAAAGGTFNLSAPGGIGTISAGNTYTLLDYTGTPLSAAAFSKFVIGTNPGNTYHYNLVNDTANTSIDLLVSTGVPTWNVNANGNWSTDANWTPSQASGVDDTASFGGVITAPRTVTLDVARTVGNIIFDNTNAYTISGTPALTMQVSTGSASITSNSGTGHTISVPITLASPTTVTVTGAGNSMFITGVVSGAQVLTKQGLGQLVFTAKPTNTSTLVSAGSIRAAIAIMPAAVTDNSVVYMRDTATATYTGVISGNSSGILYDEYTQAGTVQTHTYTGNNTIAGTVEFDGGGAVQLGGANGAFSAASTINVDRAETFILNEGTNNNNRLGDSATLNLNGGYWVWTGNSTAATTETIGQLHLGTGGVNWLTTTPGAAGFTVTAGTFSRDPGGVMLVRGATFGTNTGGFAALKFTTAPSGANFIGGGGAAGAANINIMPSIFVVPNAAGDAGLAVQPSTYDATLGVRPLAASEFSTTFTTGDTTTLNNFAPGGAVAVTLDSALNSIKFGGAASGAFAAGQTVTITSGKTLTINSGLIMSNGSSASTITGGTLAFGAGGTGEAIIDVQSTTAASTASDGGGLTIASPIHASSLTKEGTNPLILTGTNNFTGTTYVDRGRLIINANNQLGNGVVVGNSGLAPNFASQYNFSGSLSLKGSVSYNIPLTLGGNTSSGTNSVGEFDQQAGVSTWAGPITLTGQGVNSGDRLLNSISSSGTLVVTGVIGSSFLTTGDPFTGVNYTGSGALVLAGNSPNTFKGLFRIQGGTVIVEKDGAFGTTNPFSVDDNVIMNGSFGDTVAFQAPSTSPGGFNYSQNEWIFTNSGNDIGGGATFNGVNYGVVGNVSGANTFAGSIGFGNTGNLLLGYQRMNIASGSLEVSGLIAQQGAGTRIIDKWGTGDLILSGNNNDTTTILAQSFATTFASGAGININQGRVILRSSNPNGGNLPSAFTTINVSGGASLVLDNSLAANTNRLSSGTAINLTGLGAEFKLVGNATSSLTQSVGTLNVASYSTVTSQNGGGTGVSELDLPGFDPSTSRSNRGTVLLRGMDNVTSSIKFVSAPALLGGGGTGSQTSILPPAVGDTNPAGVGTDFVTVQGGFARILAPSEYIPLASGNASPDNTTAVPFDNGGANHLTANLTEVNSIKMSGGTTISIDSGKRLWVFSGAILGVGTAPSTIVGAVSFEQNIPAGVYNISDPGSSTIGAYATDPTLGPAPGFSDAPVAGTSQEGIITVPTGSTLVQDASGSIDGAQGLTKSGGGTLQLFGTNNFGGVKAYWYYDGGEVDTIPATDSTSAEPLTINAGRLEFNTDANLGYALSGIVLNGGTLAPLQVSTSSRSIFLASVGTNTIDVGTGGDFTTTGLVTGTGLTKNGNGVLGLANVNNTYSGGTVINAGRIRIVPTAAVGHPELGTGSITLAGGSIETDDNTVFDRSLVSTSINTTGGFYIASGKTLTFGSGSVSTNAITGSGNIGVDGGGTLILANVNGTQMSFSGRFFITNGSTLQYIPNDAATPNVTAGLAKLPTSGQAWTLSNGGILRFNLSSTSLADFGLLGIGIGTGGGSVDIVGTNTLNNNGALAGTGTLTKVGTGELGLRANAVAGNSGFSGKFIISNGTFSIGDQGIALTGGDAVTLLGTGTDTGAIPFMQVYGNTEFLFRANSATGVPLTMKTTQSIMLTDDATHSKPAIGTATNVFTINGVIKSDPVNPAVGLQLDARSSSLVLAGSNTYSGDTFIKTLAAAGGSGIVRTGKANTLPSTTTVHFDAQSATGVATLDLSPAGTTTAFDQTVAGIINDGTLGTVTIRNSSATAVANLTINNAADDTFSGNLTGTTLNINHTGAGTLVLTGAATNFGGLDGTGNTTIGDGANAITVSANHYRQNTLTVSANSTAKSNAVASLTDATQSAAAVSRVSTLNLGTAARLDLNNTKLIVAGGSQVGAWNTGLNAYDGITGLVQAGRNGGAWNGTSGIITSQTQATNPSNTNTFLTTLAVASAADVKGLSGSATATFAGQTVGATDTLVMYTYAGDANLDGKVDADDYFQIDSNYNKTNSNPGFGYFRGDFNYDGVVNGDDYFLIDASFAAQGSTVIAHGAPALDAGASLSGGVAAVPEPASLSVLVLGAGLLGRRRRRKM